MNQEAKPPLNLGQKEAVEGVFQFLFSDEKSLNIKGPAGVGKTFLMGHLISEVIPQYEEACKLLGVKNIYTEVEMTATTNKAAEVLGLSTGMPTGTIHSFLSLKIVEDFKTGKVNLTKGKQWKVHTNKIIFIDEGSTADSDLHRAINEGTKDCKIIYVSDDCQLGPVMEESSPIYNQNYPEFELLQPMRNAEQPDLQALCAQLRQTVKTGMKGGTNVFLPIHAVPGVIDILDFHEAEAEIVQFFSEKTPDARILAYHNARVVEFNNWIRGLRQLPDTYTIGETLVNANAMQMTDGMLSVEEEVTILDEAVNNRIVHLPDNAELEVRDVDIRTGQGRVYQDVPLPVDREHFAALLNYYKKAKNWVTFYNMKATYLDLRPRDAATVHKAQGSTYDTVFIDAANLSLCHNPKVAARLLYVAASRARNRVVWLGSLANKYGGFIR